MGFLSAAENSERGSDRRGAPYSRWAAVAKKRGVGRHLGHVFAITSMYGSFFKMPIAFSFVRGLAFVPVFDRRTLRRASSIFPWRSMEDIFWNARDTTNPKTPSSSSRRSANPGMLFRSLASEPSGYRLGLFVGFLLLGGERPQKAAGFFGRLGRTIFREDRIRSRDRLGRWFGFAPGV